MPLKHDIETGLIVLLGLMTALAGMVAAFLPPVSVSIFPWALAFIVSLVYPLLLYPMLKNKRADYEFRALHFMPALILLVWLVLELLADYKSSSQFLQNWFTSGWSVLIVSATFAMIILFCLRVIRQRTSRILLLLAVFLPFIILSQVSELRDWDSRLAARLWGDVQTGSGILAGSTSSNLSPSSDPVEEQWREQLRRMEERRRERAQQSGSSGASEDDHASSKTIVAGGQSSSARRQGSASSVPPHLPSSGFGMETMGVIFAAGYCTALHRRTIKRRGRIHA